MRLVFKVLFILFISIKTVWAYPYQNIIEEASSRYGVEIPLIKAVIMQESRWKADAVSPVGAAGLMQLMPGTGRDMGIQPRERFNAYKNIMAGTKYLAQEARLLKKKTGGGILLAVASYNAGRGHIQDSIKAIRSIDTRAVLAYLPRITGRHAKETQNYVKQVYKFYKKYGGTNIEAATGGLDFKTNDALGKLSAGAIASGAIAVPGTAWAEEIESNFQATVGSLSDAIDKFTEATASIDAVGIFILLILGAGFLLWAAVQIKSYWDLFSISKMEFKEIMFMSFRTVGLVGILFSILTVT